MTAFPLPARGFSEPSLAAIAPVVVPVYATRGHYAAVKRVSQDAREMPVTFAGYRQSVKLMQRAFQLRGRRVTLVPIDTLGLLAAPLGSGATERDILTTRNKNRWLWFWVYTKYLRTDQV
jgi:hypothetical protein